MTCAAAGGAPRRRGSTRRGGIAGRLDPAALRWNYPRSSTRALMSPTTAVASTSRSAWSRRRSGVRSRLTAQPLRFGVCPAQLTGCARSGSSRGESAQQRARCRRRVDSGRGSATPVRLRVPERSRRRDQTSASRGHRRPQNERYRAPRQIRQRTRPRPRPGGCDLGSLGVCVFATFAPWAFGEFNDGTIGSNTYSGVLYSPAAPIQPRSVRTLPPATVADTTAYSDSSPNGLTAVRSHHALRRNSALWCRSRIEAERCPTRSPAQVRNRRPRTVKLWARPTVEVHVVSPEPWPP